MIGPLSIVGTRLSRACVFGTALVCSTLFAPWVAAAPSPAQEPPTKVAPPASSAWHGAQDLAIYALGLLGVDYRFGGTTPERGLDCSGLVRYVFQQVTGVTLPRTSQELSRLGEKVAASDLMPGDLVFFNTRQLQFSHVGIYLGENRFIHAPRKGGEVEIVTLSKAYWQKHFDGARRLVGALPDLIPTAEASTGQIDTQPDAHESGEDRTTTQGLEPEELLP
jgi:cell wall-associated NlpC family hydrolase